MDYQISAWKTGSEWIWQYAPWNIATEIAKSQDERNVNMNQGILDRIEKVRKGLKDTTDTTLARQINEDLLQVYYNNKTVPRATKERLVAHLLEQLQRLDTAGWIYVTSDSLKAIKYDETQQRLFVEFNNGGVYTFKNVPLAVWYAFASASSKGKFFIQNIKGRYTDDRYVG